MELEKKLVRERKGGNGLRSELDGRNGRRKGEREEGNG